MTGAVGTAAGAGMEAIAAILEARTLPACVDAFRAIIRPLGIDAFSCGEVDVAERTRSVFYVMEWPDAWRDYYVSSGLINRDPIMEAMPSRHAPFTWMDMRRDRTMPVLGTEALERAAAAGWTDGLIVPLPRGGTRFGLVSMTAQRKTISEAEKLYVAPAAVCFHERVRTMIVAHGFPLPPARLTPREIECMRLVARGLPDTAIAAALSISAATAHEHVEQAKRKLGVTTRAGLVGQGVSFGIIQM